MYEFSRNGRVLAVAIGVAAVLSGCGANKPVVESTAHAATVQKSISAIEGNPNIPTVEKQQIIAVIQQHVANDARVQH